MKQYLWKKVASFAVTVLLYSILFFSATGEEKETQSAELWSLLPVSAPAIPQKYTGAEIDFFLKKQLEEAGLQFSPQADRQTRIRRLYLVALGMPPTPSETRSFLVDESHLAWEQLVDKALADPRYGERWAQQWLDVIRWAETVGFETNLARPNAWPYRDWLIRALNEDKPYDRFVFEQLAGDTVSEDAALGFLVAGPANLPGQIGRDEEAMRSARQDELDEVIRTVSQSMMGLTIACARCHDHKFDPITERDYYAFQAIFAGLRYGERRLRGRENDDWTQKIPSATTQVNSLQEEVDALSKTLILQPPVQDLQEEIFAPQMAQAVRMKIRETDNLRAASLYEFEIWTHRASKEQESRNVALEESGGVSHASSFALANQTRHHENLIDGSVDSRQAFPWTAASSGPAWIEIDLAQTVSIDRIVFHKGSSTPVDYQISLKTPEGNWKPVADSKKRALRLSDQRSADTVSLQNATKLQIEKLVSANRSLRAAKAELSKLSAGPQVFAASFNTPEATYVLHRGDAMQRKDEIGPAIPQAFGDIGIDSQSPEIERRLALARHLTSGEHPLTARVIVNRVWQTVFGKGLVETSSDFGKMGQAPSHPALLDWLAHHFVSKQGWSLKKLHRELFLSDAFQQQSAPNEKALRVDAESRLLWRFPPRRVEAEVIRDSILFVSGKLNPKSGGVGFDFFREQGGLSDYHPHETFEEDGWRRMIYARKIRMQSVNIFGAFDCPDAGQMKPVRTRSITPLQALSLMNSPFSNRQASFLAERIQSEIPDGPADEQVQRAFELALSRPPDSEELREMSKVVEDFGLAILCRSLFNTSEFVMVP